MFKCQCKYYLRKKIHSRQGLECNRPDPHLVIALWNFNYMFLSFRKEKILFSDK
jgi:hypothetical protein